MSQFTECNLLSINQLVNEYVDNDLNVALDILELYIENNLHSLNEAINELNYEFS